MTKVKKFVIGELETNTYVLESGGVFAVIDPAENNEELLHFLSGKNVKYVLLTHGHFDHISGVNLAVNKTGASVCVHFLDSEMLRNGDKSFYTEHYGGIQPEIKADILLNDGDEISLGETKLRVMHTPGHTNGSVCYIIEKDRLIFSGDTLFRLSAGRTDLAGISPFVAARQELASLKKLAMIPGDFTVYPGHGEETTLQFERENNRYIT